MTYEDIFAGMKKDWEAAGSPTTMDIEVKKGEPTFDASAFMESLSYSNTPPDKRST
jgi:hypothetical protein